MSEGECVFLWFVAVVGLLITGLYLCEKSQCTSLDIAKDWSSSSLGSVNGTQTIDIRPSKACNMTMSYTYNGETVVVSNMFSDIHIVSTVTNLTIAEKANQKK